MSPRDALAAGTTGVVGGDVAVAVGDTDVAAGGTDVAVAVGDAGMAVGSLFPQPAIRTRTIVTVVTRRTWRLWMIRPM